MTEKFSFNGPEVKSGSVASHRNAQAKIRSMTITSSAADEGKNGKFDPNTNHTLLQTRLSFLFYYRSQFLLDIF